MRRLAVYAHWDPQGRVKKYVLHTLERLREDCDSLTFVSTAGLPEVEVDRVRPFCETVVQRENVGFDFTMWRDAITATDLAAWDELIIINSSVIGPIIPLRPIFQRMSETGCDFWGMTECKIWSGHLQSYFLVFRSRLLRSNAFAEFWRSVIPYREKMQIVRSYELGLTRYFVDQGFRYEALVRYADLVRGVRRGSLGSSPFGPIYRAKRRFRAWQVGNEPLNPTHVYPMELLALGMPFVKYELFRDNVRGFSLPRVYEALEAAGYPRALLADA